jgi:hypothetical protein
MDRRKLQLDDLDVTSFHVTPEAHEPQSAILAPYKTFTPADPTANTGCFYCPPPTLGDPILAGEPVLARPAF